MNQSTSNVLGNRIYGKYEMRLQKEKKTTCPIYLNDVVDCKRVLQWKFSIYTVHDDDSLAPRPIITYKYGIFMWKDGNMMLQTNVMTLFTRIVERMWIWKL